MGEAEREKTPHAEDEAECAADPRDVVPMVRQARVVLWGCVAMVTFAVAMEVLRFGG